MLTSILKGVGCLILWLLTLPYYLLMFLFVPKSKRKSSPFYGSKSFLGICALANIRYWFS